MSTVHIKNGMYRTIPVENMHFTVVKNLTKGAKGNYITVRQNGQLGEQFPEVVRIKIARNTDFDLIQDDDDIIEFKNGTAVTSETDEEIMERISTRFQILDDMTKAAIAGDIRAMIVAGPPGVGKSYGVEAQLEKANLFTRIQNAPPKYEIIKGAMSPIGLYAALYKNSGEGNVLVFDDCDNILFDEISLNLLKAALDSGKKRRICWNSDSHLLRREGIPDSFDFKGSAIFITNINFDNVKSKKLQDHLGALHSRCHYLDLTLDTMRDKFLRIKQIFRSGQLFQNYSLSPEQSEEILHFMDQNKEKLREMSLRMALKIADLTKVGPHWKTLATCTCMK